MHRLKRVAEGNHLIIDRMLKENNSIVNDLSGYTTRTRIKDTKNISIIYVCNLDKKEIVVPRVFRINT